MSEPGRGEAVDGIDRSCENYKKCLKCVREKFGNSCIPEFTTFKISQLGDEKICREKPKTCRGEICECGRKFAKEYSKEVDNWNSDFHTFWSNLPNGWNPKNESCKKSVKKDEKC